VSRIEVTAYAHGATELLGVQIDAAINSGNSGGCVQQLQDCIAGGSELPVRLQVASAPVTSWVQWPALHRLSARLNPVPFPPLCRSPVFNELGEVVGIAFQSYAGSDAENIGYVIPTPGALQGCNCAVLLAPAVNLAEPFCLARSVSTDHPVPTPQCLPSVLGSAVIAHFLDDYRAIGDFTGFPALGVQWQRMESEALRCAVLAELTCFECCIDGAWRARR